ncbi:MAG: signal peptidase II [Pirellulales bacterium]
MSNALARSEATLIGTSSFPKVSAVAYFVIAILGTAIDLATKQAVFSWRGLPGEQPPWWLIRNYVGIETAVNEGALFGMGAGYGRLFAIFSIFAAIGILVWLFYFQAVRSKWLTVALGCVTAGIGGNLYDRLGLWVSAGMPEEWNSGVRDWILFRYGQYTWPNFNIADSLLVCGAIMLAWHTFMTPEPESAPTPHVEGK